MSKFFHITLLTIILAAFSHSAFALPKSETARNEHIVVKFYTKIFIKRQDVEKVANRFLTEDYIQHNPYVATGRQGFIDGLGGWLPTVPDARYEIKRVISSGDLVMLHIHSYEAGSDSPGSAGIDIFRVNKEGKISEHWDVWQEIPEWMAHENGMF